MDELPQTENSSGYDHIEKMSVMEIVSAINSEDQLVAQAVKSILPEISQFIEAAVERMRQGGRLFYIGAGTSGRLGILDASECPPTFGVSHDLVVGIIAGGDGAIRRAVEFAEDDEHQAWKDLEAFMPDPLDTLVGLAASGTTPYVIGGIKQARARGLLTGCISCSPGSPLGAVCEFPMEVAPGPEFITGSTRMKSGTAQKMILNMISTTLMIQLGRVKGNKMVDMQLSNHKLEKRAIRMILSEWDIGEVQAKELLKKHGSVRAVLATKSTK